MDTPTAIVNTILESARTEDNFGTDQLGRPSYSPFPSVDEKKQELAKKLTMALAEIGAGGQEDLSTIIVKQIAQEIVKPIYEGFARKMCKVNTQLIGTPGLSIRFPTKGRTIAARVEELGEVLIGQGKLAGVDAETYLIASRAVWGYGAIEARLIDHIADEIVDCRSALQEFEMAQIAAVLLAGTNTTTVVTGGTLAWADLVNMRADVGANRFRADTLGVHPDQLANLLTDTSMQDIRMLARMEVTGDAMYVVPKIGLRIFESANFTAATAHMWSSRNAVKMAIKTPVNVIKYDGGPVGVLEKGVIAWEMMDVKLVQGLAATKMTGC